MLTYEKIEAFGINNYEVPRGEIARLKSQNAIISKSKKGGKKSFFDEHSLSKKFVPGPGNYMKHDKWDDLSKDTKLGKFRPGKNINFFNQLCRTKSGIPAPNKYDKTNYDRTTYKIKLTGFTKTEAKTNFIEDVVERSKERPPVTRYKAIPLHVTKGRSKNANFSIITKDMGSRL